MKDDRLLMVLSLHLHNLPGSSTNIGTNFYVELRHKRCDIDGAVTMHCTEVRNGRFSSGGGILSQLQWYQSDIQKLGFPKYEIKDN